MLGVLMFCFSCNLVSIAQNPVRIIKKEMNYTISFKKNWSISTHETKYKKVLSTETAKSHELNEYAFGDEFNVLSYLRGATLVHDEKGRLKRVVAENAIKEEYNSKGIFYSGASIYTLAFPAIKNGAIIESECLTRILKPELIPPFYFNEFLECDTVIVTVEVDNGIEFNAIPFFYKFENNISYSEEITQKGTRIMKWVATDMSAEVREANSLGASCVSPHLMFHIKSYVSDGETQYVLRDKNDLFNWYNSLIEEYEISDEYNFILDSLRKNATTKIDLAESIFNWVQHNIKYIAFEDGMGGFVPRSPSSVLKKRYGDCKDMAVLTKTIMNAAGLECYIAWVGTRDKCYSYETCPTPYVDNHMIAAFPSDTGIVFLDATSSFSEFGFPSAFIQGKEAMVRMNEGIYKVLTIPVIDANMSGSVDSVRLEINGDKLTGRGINYQSGFQKVRYENLLSYDVSDAEGLFSEIHFLGNKSFKIKSFEQTNTNTNKGFIKTDYTFDVSNYFKNFDNIIYINPFVKSLSLPDLTSKRLDYSIPFKYKESVTVLLSIPSGAKLTNVIDPCEVSIEGLLFKMVAVMEGNQLVLTYTYECDRLLITQDEFSEVKNFVKTVQKKMKQQYEITYEN